MLKAFTNVSVYTLLAFVVTSCGSKSTDSGSEAREKYIVVLSKSVRGQVHTKAAVNARMADVVARTKLGSRAEKIFSSVLQGGVMVLSPDEALDLAADPDIAIVEPDQVITINAVQTNPVWNLDRVDQSDLPLDGQFVFPEVSTVNAYVVDTGVRTTHVDFGGRAFSGYDAVDNDSNSDDCNGHGTHVAGSLGSTTFGVAKNANIIGVRVLDCNGNGSLSNVIEGLEWVANNHVKPAVANMSLGGSPSQALDQAVVSLVSSGVTVVVAAGNESRSACGGSPSRVAQALTVGATSQNDRRARFSNFGNCMDVFAPGDEILSLGIGSSTATRTLNGTSMAAPMVAGAAALYLGANPSATPSEVMGALLSAASPGKVIDAQAGTPNLLLNTSFLNDIEVDPEPEPEPEEPVEEDPNLEDGVARNELSGERGSEQLYVFELNEDVSKLTVGTMGGTGDVDLYVKQGSAPTRSDYDCRPYLAGNSETCEFESPSQGTYYVLLRAYDDYESVTLRAKTEALAPVDPRPCTDCHEESGTLTGSSDASYHPGGRFYETQGQASHQIWLEGPSTADLDIFLMKWSGSQWETVARSAGSTSNEQINYLGEPGYYTIKVDSFNGSGEYDLYFKY